MFKCFFSFIVLVLICQVSFSKECKSLKEHPSVTEKKLWSSFNASKLELSDLEAHSFDKNSKLELQRKQVLFYKMSRLLLALCEYEKSLDYGMRHLNIIKKLYSDDDIMALRSYLVIATNHTKLEQIPQAIWYLEKIAKVYIEKKLVNDELAFAFELLYQIYLSEINYIKAEEFLDKHLFAQKQINGDGSKRWYPSSIQRSG